MNTPQEFEPLGYWMGWEKSEVRGGPRSSIWWDGLESRGEVATKTSLTDAECIEALNRLAEKGYGYGLAGNSTSHGVAIFSQDGTKQIAGALGQPTINQAVEQAILKLIEAEKS